LHAENAKNRAYVYNVSLFYSARGKNGNQKESCKEEGKESCEETCQELRLLQIIFFPFSNFFSNFFAKNCTYVYNASLF